ncbi:MAG: hypothetical protein ACRDIB_16840 [Ardenticatenaceae bacterium]
MEDRYTFYVEEDMPLLGQLWVVNSSDEAHDIVIMCLVDYVQTPCQPDGGGFSIRKFAPYEEFFMPVEIRDLDPGVHEFAFLIVRDPYHDINADQSRPTGRSSPSEVLPFYTIYVGNQSHLPVISPIVPEMVRARLDRFGGNKIFVNKLPDLVEPPRNGAPAWLMEEAAPGEKIQSYLHFTEDTDPNPNSKNIVVMAFVDYVQVPLYADDQLHMPLYVKRQPDTFQTLPIAMQAPAKPGIYELIIVAQDYAHQRLSAQPKYFHYADHGSSSLIRLEVKAP